MRLHTICIKLAMYNVINVRIIILFTLYITCCTTPTLITYFAPCLTGIYTERGETQNSNGIATRNPAFLEDRECGEVPEVHRAPWESDSEDDWVEWWGYRIVGWIPPNPELQMYVHTPQVNVQCHFSFVLSTCTQLMIIGWTPPIPLLNNLVCVAAIVFSVHMYAVTTYCDRCLGKPSSVVACCTLNGLAHMYPVCIHDSRTLNWILPIF